MVQLKEHLTAAGELIIFAINLESISFMFQSRNDAARRGSFMFESRNDAARRGSFMLNPEMISFMFES